MISRNELENLIVQGLVELRRAESKLTQRRKRLSSSSQERVDFLISLADLQERASRLESMLSALAGSRDVELPEAA